MTGFPTSNGVPYLPDSSDPAIRSRAASPLWLQALCFLVVFATLQGLYDQAANTWLQRFFVETLGSQPAAVLIRLVTPDIPVQANGARLVAPGGGITIRGGCEGTEVLFLLVAGFAAISLPWRRRLGGIAIGALLVFLFNQVRILSLFYALRADPAWFDTLHTITAPIIFIGAITWYFYAWTCHGGTASA